MNHDLKEKDVEKLQKLKEEWLKRAGENPEPMDLVLTLLIQINTRLARLEGWLAGTLAIAVGLLIAIAAAVF